MNEQKIHDYIANNKAEMLQTLKELCHIPAPSHFEQERAEYCKKWLENMGAKGVYIDEALNVIFPLNCEGSNEITVFVAHTDTVFPDTEPMPYVDDGEKIHCPGVGDDTACVSVLMMLAKYYVENNIQPQGGVMFVCNSCEEGLGDLKGTKQLFKDYAGRINQFISFDANVNIIYNNCAGSHRYEVEVLTEGGHSYNFFGKKNAIHALSEIITKIYEIEIPQKGIYRTTYNVGEITGGTSVNTIAQHAKMLCEYRSENKDCLRYMEKQFFDIFEAAKTDEVKVNVKKVGDRPCNDTDPAKIQALVDKVRPTIEAIIGKETTVKSASTDCNIPYSLGIPAICIGAYYGKGGHTREEYVLKDSLVLGLEIALKISAILMEVTL